MNDNNLIYFNLFSTSNIRTLYLVEKKTEHYLIKDFNQYYCSAIVPTKST